MLALCDGENTGGMGSYSPVPGFGLAEPRDRAYDAAGRIEFEGMQTRSDIAARAVERVAS